jgi:hypothetical protein
MKKTMILVLLLSVNIFACDKGYIDYEGTCAADPKPAVDVDATILPSDEKPPQSGKPSYEAEGVHADMPGVAVEPVITPASDDLGKTIPNGGVPQK